MKFIYPVLFLLFGIHALAQEKGKVIVNQDPLIDSLIAKRIALYTENNQTNNTKIASSLIGYRVQIYYGSSRNKLFDEQNKFRTNYPQINTYINYKEPNYHLKVGDFRTRLEAQKFLTELKATYPTLFIFREKINPPPLDGEK